MSKINNKKEESKKEQKKEQKKSTKSKTIDVIIDLSKVGYVIDPNTGQKTTMKFVNEVELGLFIFAIPINTNLDDSKYTYFKVNFETTLKVQPIGLKNGYFWCQGRIKTAKIKDKEKIGTIYI